MLDLLPQRINEKIASDDSCWVWLGTTGGTGYGRVRWKSRMVVAHRVVYELLVGPIPKGLTLDHLCRNTLCVNPAHLEPVTNRDNIRRGIGPTAVNARKTHCINGHPLSGGNLSIYRRKDRGEERRCLTCHRERQHRYDHERRTP